MAYSVLFDWISFLRLTKFVLVFPFFSDASKLKDGNAPTGKVVFNLNHPRNDRVQNMTLPKRTRGRIVSLRLPGKKELRFREVEVYNGALLGMIFTSISEFEW